MPAPSAGVWTGRNRPHRKDRAWVQAWSPEQIANRLKFDFPNDESQLARVRPARARTSGLAVEIAAEITPHPTM